MPTTTGIATEFITFTRASNATVTDSDGLVKWAPHNLLLASESFDAASWSKSSVTPTANSIAAPNGTTTADTLAASGANGTTLQTFTAEAVSYTFGVWLKRKTGTGNIQIAADSGTYTTVTITSDWALYTVTQTPAAGSKSAGIRIVTSADEVYAWGASLYRSDLAMQPNTSAYPLYNPTTPKNLLGYTESLTTGWTNTNTTDAIVSEVNPVGLTGAVDVAATAGNGTLLSSLSLLASPYTFSIWLKRKTGGGTVEITVDGTTYVAAAVTGTWTRFSTTLTPTAGTKTPGIRLVTSGDAVYAWGAQLSDSASLDSYVPVYGAAVTSAAYYGPRRDFDPVTLACKGLLVEEQRVNTIVGSANFSGGGTGWVLDGASLTTSATAGPDGSLSATSIVQGTGNNRTYQFDNSNVTGSKIFSIYVKPNAGSSLSITAVGGMSPNGPAVINATTGAVTGFTGASSVAVGNGWYRVYLPVTVTVASGGGTYWVISGPASSVFIWGAQLEAGSFATSYIPTGAAQATRNADVASVSTQAFPYSSAEGTWVFNISRNTAGGNNWMFGASPSNQCDMVAGNSSVNFRYGLTGGIDAESNYVIGSSGGKAAGAYTTGGTHAISVNGNAVLTSSTSTDPGQATVIRLGTDSGPTPGRQLNGHIRQITYLPRRISNADLVTRST